MYENENIWDRMMDKGWRKIGLENYGEQDVANRLSPVDISNIASTWKFTKVNIELVRQVHQDLWGSRFRVFDWLGMLITGRNIGYPDERDTQRYLAVALTKIFSDIYLLPSFTDIRLLGPFLEHEDFLQPLLEQEVTWEVESCGDTHLILHFHTYALPNRWGGPTEDYYATIPPQDWVISKQGYLK